MADDVRLNLGSGGDLIAADEVGGAKHQRVKVGHGADGVYGDVEDTNPLPVQLLDSSGNAVKVTNNGLDINIQDQHTTPVDGRFVKVAGAPTTLSAQTVPGAYTLTLTSTLGFVDGRGIGLASTSGFSFFAHQIGAPVGNVITLDTPVDRAFETGTTTVLNLTHSMLVDGSVTHKIFQVGPIGAVSEVDIVRILIYLQDDTEMDDSLFAGQAALTRGIVLRHYRAATGDYNNLWNAKSNGELALLGYDFSYAAQAKFGSYGARCRITYGGPSKHGVTIRLAANDILELVIQDDLTGLEEFNMMAQGHVVE